MEMDIFFCYLFAADALFGLAVRATGRVGGLTSLAGLPGEEGESFFEEIQGFVAVLLGSPGIFCPLNSCPNLYLCILEELADFLDVGVFHFGFLSFNECIITNLDTGVKGFLGIL